MLRLKLIFVLFVASLVSAQVKLPLSSEVSTSLVKFPSIWPALLSEDALTVTMNSSSTTLDEVADSNDRALLRRLPVALPQDAAHWFASSWSYA